MLSVKIKGYICGEKKSSVLIIHYKLIGMKKLNEIIITAIITVLLTIFLPKQIQVLIREFVRFIFKSIFKYWYLVILIAACCFLFNFYTKNVYLGENTSIRFILTTFVIVILIISCLGVFKILFKRFKPINIAIYGCYSIKENEYLTIDIDSESLNDIIEKTIKDATSNVFTYRKNLIKIIQVSIPKFIPILLGYKKFNDFVRKRVDLNNHLATLHFIRDINTQNVRAIINYGKQGLTNIEPIKNAEKLITNLSLDPNLNNIKSIELSVKIFLLLFGQSVIDFLIDNKEFDIAHNILDDTEKLIVEIKTDSIEIPEKLRTSIENFLSVWLGNVERYKAILLIDQKQFSGAIKHIIKSIKLNPYYPYDNYISLKQDITKKYAIEMIPALNENQKVLETGVSDEVNNKVKENLLTQIKYVETTFNYEIIKEILLKANSKEIEDLLVEELKNSDKNNPFVLYIEYEVIKYIKKGDDKFNEMYVARFDDCINLLYEILKLDSDFPLIYTKLGTMLFMKGVHFSDDELIERGGKEYKKGIHIMTELGFDFSQKTNEDFS